jgi:hypothetical protein
LWTMRRNSPLAPTPATRRRCPTTAYDTVFH